MVVKSFFMGIGILHISGPLARHRFQRDFPYTTTWEGVWRNQAVIGLLLAIPILYLRQILKVLEQIRDSLSETKK